MKKRMLFVTSLVIVAALVGSSACNRVILRAKDREMEPVSRVFHAPPKDAYKAAREALARLGYKIQSEDESEGTLKTLWLSTKATSHYVDLFDRRDYGTVGAYYRIQMTVKEENGASLVEVSAPVRSVIGRIKSSHSAEDKVLDKIADLLRPEDFEMTNVGVKE